MTLRLNLMLVTTLLIAASMACGSNSAPRPTPTVPFAPTGAPPTAAAPPPTTTGDPLGATRDAIAASPVLRAPGWLIYLRGNDLYAGDLLTGNEVPLTEGSLGAGYAGRAEFDGRTWVYYTSIIDETHEAGTPTGTFAVYRRVLGATKPEEKKLFEFAASDRYLVEFSYNASVSPDGRDVAYTDDDGLHIYDIESHDDQLLLSNQRATSRLEPGGGIHGVRYSNPIWAPAGGWLYIRSGEDRWPYNGYDETVRPLESNAEYRLVRSGHQWSPDGQHLCGDTSQTAASGIGILTPGSAETLDLTLNLFDNLILRPTVNSCAWAEDGRLAVGYDTDGIKHFIIAILDPSGTPTERIDAGAIVPGVDHWLPDRSGFVISTLADVSRSEASAALLDGTYRRLPFDAERVLGTIPVLNR